MEKYKYSSDSTVHMPIEVGQDGTVHTWTLVLGGQMYRVTREVWEAVHMENSRRADVTDALREAADLVLEWHDKNLRDGVEREYAISQLRAAITKAKGQA